MFRLIGCAVALALLPAESGCQREQSRAKATATAPTSAASTRQPVAAANAVAAPASPQPGFGCDELPLLGVYRAAGVVRESSARRVVLDLNIDLHSLDCGAPDGYGERLSVELDVEPDGERCRLRQARVASKSFAVESTQSASWSDAFDPAEPVVDLAAIGLEQVTLRARGSARALILGQKQYWFFDDIKPKSRLLQQLEGEESDPHATYGFTSAQSSSWQFEHYFSGFALHAPPLEPPERDKFNRWATNFALRHDLEQLVRRAFALEPKYPLDIKLSEGAVPMAATVRASDDLPDAPEVVLRFSRKACPNCRGGATGWWLWDAQQTL